MVATPCGELPPPANSKEFPEKGKCGSPPGETAEKDEDIPRRRNEDGG